MRWPSIKDVAAELRAINSNVEGECDVRLQVYEDGQWIVRSGPSDYDQDHHGYWGSGRVPGVVRGVQKRFSSSGLAAELLDQAKDAEAEAR